MGFKNIERITRKERGIVDYEKMWNELKDFVSEEYRKTSIMQEIYAYYEVIKEIEQLEKENEG